MTAFNGVTINGYTVGGGGGLTLVSLTPNATALALTFSDSVELVASAANVASWSIDNTGGGVPVVVYMVNASGTNVILATSGHTAGKSYTLNVPIGILGTITGESYPAPTSLIYTGVGTGLAFTATPLDARTLIIVYNEPVMVQEALVPGNYMFTNSLNCINVVQNTTLQFTLTTSEMVPGTSYTVVASVYSQNGN